MRISRRVRLIAICMVAAGAVWWKAIGVIWFAQISTNYNLTVIKNNIDLEMADHKIISERFSGKRILRIHRIPDNLHTNSRRYEVHLQKGDGSEAQYVEFRK